MRSLVIVVPLFIVLVVTAWAFTSSSTNTYPSTTTTFPQTIVPGRDFLIEKRVSVEGVKIRDLEPVEGIFIYNTSIAETSEGPLYGVLIYNVSRLNETSWIITMTVKTYLGGSVTNHTHTFIVKNNTIYFIETRTENVVYKWNTIKAPVSPDCILLLVSPPFWPYVAEKAKWRVSMIGNSTYKYLHEPFTVISKAVEEAEVVGTKDCKGPSGKCFIIKSIVNLLTNSNGISKTKELNYIFYVDSETGIITYAKYGKYGEEVRLVEWVIRGRS